MNIRPDQQQQQQQQQHGGFHIGGHQLHRPHLRDVKNQVLGHHQGPTEVICGPLLRYINTDYQTRRWRGSCLIVSNASHTPPPLHLELTPITADAPSASSENSSNVQVVEARAECLDSFRRQYYFWRYEISLPLLSQGQHVRYSCPSLPEQTFDFYLPAIQQSMRFMFHSCNGFSDIAQDIKDSFGYLNHPLWQDVLDRHHVMPFHVLIGGGDQLYQDKVIKEDFMGPWKDERSPSKRLCMTLTQEMVEGMETFYFNNYVENFGKQNPWVAKAFASIPSINMWDDHDIIDGYGSYPAEMQNCHCFKVLFENACRFYYLFQHHTTIELAERHGMIRGTLPTCNSVVASLGPDIGILSLDCRGERNKQDICQPRTYDIMLNAIRSRLPTTVKHLLVVTGVPLIYPRLTLFEKAMDGAAGFNLATLAGKTGALGNVITGSLNKWNGDPELLDDMNDHWTAGNHLVERKKFIENLQLYARQTSIRISFLGGDVHCCASGKLYSKDMKEKEEGDPYFMVQIISSAIVNVPPPQALLTILNQNSSYITFNGNTEEKMYNIFKKSPNGNTRQNKKLMGCRNYCAGYFDETTGKINFWIQAEIEAGKKGTMGYLVDVPKLVFGQAGYHLHSQKKDHLLSSESGHQYRQSFPDHQPQQQQQQPHYSTESSPPSESGPAGSVMPQPHA
ncbi:hypothetical protein BCR42DRAFT_336858 [Absidia repens]|uniref:PhoD-like phosphatase domain-containing protein n=1 Tax=Absidia repens TaxID=90262 RepID=A0A1X2I0L2_9FUNG|nr:hypothetical protein BCR42DRAFT_336858 [Absidia repens]